jgi:uncharacterized delta-60 repeat protein
MPRLLSFFGSLLIAFSVTGQNIELFPYQGLQSNSMHNRLITDTKDGGYLIGCGLDFVNNQFVGNVARIDNDGNLVPGFARVVVNEQILAMVELDNGNILIGGEFTTVSGVNTGPLAMLRPDGTVETNFAYFPDDYFDKQWISDIVVQESGKIVVTGSFDIERDQTGGTYRGVVRLNSDGTLDNTFNPVNTLGYISAGRKDDQDNIWIVSTTAVYRTDKDGFLQPGFPVYVNDNIFIGELEVFGDHAVVAGDFTTIGGVNRSGLAVINPDGSIGDFSTTGAYGQHLSVQSNGNVIARNASPISVFSPTGEVLKVIHNGGIIQTYVDRQNRIIIMDGDFTHQRPMMRFNADLSLDENFTCSTGAILDTHSMLTFSDGRSMIFRAEPPQNKTFVYTTSRTGVAEGPQKIIDRVVQKVEGDENGFYTLTYAKVYKHDRNGNVIKTTPIATYPSDVTNMRRHGDYLYVYGLFGSGSYHSSPGIVRLLPDGSIDPSFVSKISQAQQFEAFDIQPDGKIVIGGSFIVNGQTFHVLRLKTNGDIDPDFKPGIAQFFGGSTTVRDDGGLSIDDETGNIYIYGGFWNYDGTEIDDVVKLNSRGELDASFRPPLYSHLVPWPSKTSVEVLSPNRIMFMAGSEFQDRCIMVVDSTGAVVTPPFTTELGVNSTIYEPRFDGNTLFLRGRMYPTDHSSVAHNARIVFKPVSGDFTGFAAFVNGNNVNLSWVDVPLNSTHIIIHKSVGNNSSFEAIDTVKSELRQYVDTAPSGFGYYKLLAYNSNSEKWSNEVLALMPNATLAATEVDTVSFTANWTTGAGVTGFELQWSADNFVSVLDAYAPSSPSHRVTGLEPFHHYQYRVLYQTLGGQIISDTANATTLPRAPLISGSSATPSTVKIEWTNRFDEASEIVVERALVSQGPYALVKTLSADQSSYTDSTVAETTSYYYRLLARNANISSFYSNTVSISTPAKYQQIISFDSIPPQQVGATVQLVVSTTSGLPVVIEIDIASIGEISGTQLKAKAPGTTTVRAKQSGNQNYYAAEVTRTFVVNKQAQTISFSVASPQTFGTPQVVLQATASSELPVTYSSDNTSVASVDGTLLKIHKAGKVVITASQSGNSFYLPASVTDTLIVEKANQIINFSVPELNYLSPPTIVTASSSSGLTVTFSNSDPTVASLNGNILTVHKTGTTLITTSQAGNENYLPASRTDTVTVRKASQFMGMLFPDSVDAVPSVSGLTQFASSGLLITYEVDDQSLASINGNTITFLKAGTVTLTGTQAGNENFLPVSESVTFVIRRVAQTLDFALAGEVELNSSPILLSAVCASGEPVTFAVNDENIASIRGATLILHKPGSVIVTASQDGTDIYRAVNKSITVLIRKNTQTISLHLSNELLSTAPPITIMAEASSGLPLTFGVDDPTIASVVGNVLTVHKSGAIQLTVAQAGNEYYQPATISYAITIRKVDQTITLSLADQVELSSTILPLPSMTSAGLPITYVLSDPTLATIKNGGLQLTGGGELTITASNPGDGKYNPVEVQHTLMIGKWAQQITLAPLPEEVDLNDSFVDLIAAASSGLPVTFTVNHPKMATVDENQLILHQPGVIEITVSQSGDHRYFPAESITVKLKINNNGVAPVLYPIPSDGVYNVPEIIHPCISNYNVLTSDGVIIATGTVDQLKSAGTIDLTGYEPGLYFVQFTGCKEVVTVRLLKR